jgi:peptidoglycan/LPS O-acetylase OafA/YrhL
VLATVTCFSLVGVQSHFTPLVMSMEKRALYVFAYTLGIWCWVLGLAGVALAWCSAPSARWRFLSDASYWMYLVHLPLVWALQAWMMRWPLHWSIKFALILAISGTLLLASYHYLVRATFIGKLLNGRKYPRGWPVAVTSAPSTSPG